MISPLSVPTATVKLSAISKNIRNMPASRATVTITTNSMFIPSFVAVNALIVNYQETG